MDFEYFRRTASTGAFGHNLKYELCHQPFISRIKHAEFCVRDLDGPRKYLEIQALEVLVQSPTNYLAEKGFVTLVIDGYQDRKVELSSLSS